MYGHARLQRCRQLSEINPNMLDLMVVPLSPSFSSVFGLHRLLGEESVGLSSNVYQLDNAHKVKLCIKMCSDDDERRDEGTSNHTPV